MKVKNLKRKQKARPGGSLEPVGSTAQASAYRDAEGWVLFDQRGEPTEWPDDWPSTIDRIFLRAKGITTLP